MAFIALVDFPIIQQGAILSFGQANKVVSVQTFISEAYSLWIDCRNLQFLVLEQEKDKISTRIPLSYGLSVDS